MVLKGQLDTEALEALPLLPLPEYTLFPHTLVPFHVFEPRYLKMLDACLAGRRLLVVAGLRPGWEGRHCEEDATYGIGGLGRVVSERRARDGRCNIFVHCVDRVELVRNVQDEPFRRVDVLPLPDAHASVPRKEDAVLFDRMMTLATGLARELGQHGGAIGRVLASTRDPAILSHRLAAMVVEMPQDRQQLMASPDPYTRCQMLVDHLSQRLIELTPTNTEGGLIN